MKLHRNPRSKAAARKLMYTERATPKLFRSKHVLAAVPKPTISVGFKTVIWGAADRRDDDFRHGRGQGSVT